GHRCHQKRISAGLNSMSRPSLYARCQGPNARLIDQLIRQGEKVAGEICEGFGDFLMGGLNALQTLSARFLADRGNADLQDRFLDGVRDIASSAATAGQEWVSRFATSLEDSIQSRDVHDEHM